MGLNTLEKLQLDRQIARITEDLRRVERLLQGQPIDTVRIADLAVTSAKIESLVAGKVDADTLSAIVALLGDVTVGNALNGDGTILVKNGSGITVVTINKDGILVEGGVIEVRNQDENAILDEFGLNSVNTFTGGSTIGSGGTINTSSTTYVDITGVTITFELDRTQKVLLFAQIQAGAIGGGSPNYAWGRALLDGSDTIGGEVIHGAGAPWSGSVTYTASAMQEIVELGIGSHTLKLQYKVSNAPVGNAYADKDSSVVGYVILGN